MNALAKTSDFFLGDGMSEYYGPAIYKTHRQPMIDDLFDRVNSSADTIDSLVQAKKISQLHLLPRKTISFQRNFKLLQQWEGMVEKISDDTVIAIIVDKKNADNPSEEVEIFLSEIDKEDMPFVRPGAYFYWSVGYEDGRGVPRQRVSRIRFKRMAGITARDISRAEKNATKLKSLFACSAQHSPR